MEQITRNCLFCNLASGPSAFANAHFSILHRPKLLLLHLKRFIVVEKPIYADDNRGNENHPPNSPAKPIAIDYVFKKDSVPVKMPLTLTLDAFQEAPENDETTQDYSLQSVVYHSGLRASSGHYFADALRPDLTDDHEADVVLDGDASTIKGATEDVWYCFDDTYSERRASAEAILRDPTRQRNAYMLLYAFKGDPAVAEKSKVGDAVLGTALSKPLVANMALSECMEHSSPASSVENSVAVEPKNMVDGTAPAAVLAGSDQP